MQIRPWIVRATGLALALSLAACEPPRPPVARLTIAPVEIEVTYPGYTEVTLSWHYQARERLEGLVGTPRVFVHLLDAAGGVARTFDHDVPFDWREPGSAQYAIKLYQSALAPPLATGTYPLTVGLYDAHGNRWPLEVAGEEVDLHEYQAASVDILEPAAGFPMFYFSPDWSPIETGADRQVLGRRWLGERGTVRVADIGRPGTLWLQVGIPREATGGRVLVLAEGAAEPSVTIATDCGELQTTLSGPGSHSVELPLAAAGDAPCEVSFEPNFYLEAQDTLERHSVSLENLAWSG